MVSDEINLILASVSSITEIPPEDILSKSKQSDIVDARYIVIKILYNKGYSISRVNYPQTKDLWASDFIEECPFKRLGLLSSPSV